MRKVAYLWGTPEGESTPGLGYYWHRFWEFGGDFRLGILPFADFIIRTARACNDRMTK